MLGWLRFIFKGVLRSGLGSTSDCGDMGVTEDQEVSPPLGCHSPLIRTRKRLPCSGFLQLAHLRCRENIGFPLGFSPGDQPLSQGWQKPSLGGSQSSANQALSRSPHLLVLHLHVYTAKGLVLTWPLRGKMCQVSSVGFLKAWASSESSCPASPTPLTHQAGGQEMEVSGSWGVRNKAQVIVSFVSLFYHFCVI